VTSESSSPPVEVEDDARKWSFLGSFAGTPDGRQLSGTVFLGRRKGARTDETAQQISKEGYMFANLIFTLKFCNQRNIT
jgi:hypothetical protein